MQIFVGGTGRSGTTILAKALGRHPDLFTMPSELRFVTDPDGLINLKKALVEDWSFFQADIAVERFVHLMADLGKGFWRYHESQLAATVGPDFYGDWIQHYLEALGVRSFKSTWLARRSLVDSYLIHLFKRLQIFAHYGKEANYVSPHSNEDFDRLTCNFVKSFFEKAARKNGKKYAVEHTPSNIMHTPFINKVLPDSKFIHVYRDPLDVTSSFENQVWGSRDFEINVRWLADILSTWERIKKELPSGFYLEIAFEDFINDHENVLRRLTDFLELQFDDQLLGLDLSKHNIGRYKKSLDEKTIRMIEKDYPILSNYSYQGTHF